jgi:hypothetical protein
MPYVAIVTDGLQTHVLLLGQRISPGSARAKAIQYHRDKGYTCTLDSSTGYMARKVGSNLRVKIEVPEKI